MTFVFVVMKHSRPHWWKSTKSDANVTWNSGTSHEEEKRPESDLKRPSLMWLLLFTLRQRKVRSGSYKGNKSDSGRLGDKTINSILSSTNPTTVAEMLFCVQIGGTHTTTCHSTSFCANVFAAPPPTHDLYWPFPRPSRACRTQNADKGHRLKARCCVLISDESSVSRESLRHTGSFPFMPKHRNKHIPTGRMSVARQEGESHFHLSKSYPISHPTNSDTAAAINLRWKEPCKTSSGNAVKLASDLLRVCGALVEGTVFPGKLQAGDNCMKT